MDVSELNITFTGVSPKEQVLKSVINGTIDRVTGDVEAYVTYFVTKDTRTVTYSLKCKPTQRMF